MDVVTSFFGKWMGRRTNELYTNLLNCIELGPQEMRKEEFSYMDKINEANAFKKLEVCEQEFVKMRQITFEDFERDFKRELQNWSNWKWK